MKNSGLLKWTNKINSKQSKNASKNWIHPPDALQGGHIAYLVKYLGNTEVRQPKGIEVVKEAIQKLRFNQQLKKSEGTKIPKVELTISVDGVAVQQPKSKKVQSQYPLYRISYCADDKAEKKFFSFIAKEGDSNVHICHVFISDKLSEEITLTIGQAFDLAYKRFLDNSNKEGGLKKQIISLQDDVTNVQEENAALKKILSDALLMKDPVKLQAFLNSKKNVFLTDDGNQTSRTNGLTKGTTEVELPPVPPRNANQSSPLIEDFFNNGTNDDNLDFDPRGQDNQSTENMSKSSTSEDEDNFDFNPRAFEENHKMEPFQINPARSLESNSPPTLLPPPPSGGKKVAQTNIVGKNDLMSQFDEMNIGFSHGLSFGTAEMDFNLDSLDPLKN